MIVFVLAAAPVPAAEHAHHEHQHHREYRDAVTHEATDQDPALASEKAGPRLPPITPSDRAAAFPEVSDGHPVHGSSIHYYALLDQLEWQDAEGGALAWNASGWVGRDLNRLWFRSEGERTDGHTGHAEVQLLYGRPIARWWEVVGGVRQDFAPGSAQTWAAFGVQGLAPYWFEVEATAFIGEGGQTGARLEAEYELLLSNRLILQPRVEVNLHGRNDRSRGIGSGLSDVEAGLRLRYELRREIAPYVGVSWSRKLGRTADYAEQDDENVDDTRLVAGVRFWF